jgi:hypothetical protein
MNQRATTIVGTMQRNMAPPSDLSLASMDLLARHGNCSLRPNRVGTSWITSVLTIVAWI